jgi:PBSX family phage terminase large subunit
MEIEFKKNAFIDSFYPLLFDKARYEVLRGGRGSGKSFMAVQKFCYRMLTEYNNRFLFVRAIKDTIRQSMYAQFKKYVYTNNLSSAFEFRDTDMVISCSSTNSEIIHLGLNEPQRTKSVAEPTSAWIEEPTEIDERAFRDLNLGVRSTIGGYIQTVLTFNPVDENHWLRKEFFPPQIDEILNQKYDKRIQKKRKTGDKWIDYDIEDVSTRMVNNVNVNGLIIPLITTQHLSTYEDNPFVNPEYRAELEDLKGKDYPYWLVCAKAQWGTVGDRVFDKMWKFAEFPQSCDEVFYGLDFGYIHPAALVMVGIKDKKYYVKELAYIKGEVPRELIQTFKEENLIEKDGLIYADAESPSSIDEFEQAGFNIVPAIKGQGSVNDGVQFMKSVEIFTHSDNVNLNRELKTWKRKIGSDGKPIEGEYSKLNEDCIAATRYAIWSHAQQHDVKVGFVTRVA